MEKRPYDEDEYEDLLHDTDEEDLYIILRNRRRKKLIIAISACVAVIVLLGSFWLIGHNHAKAIADEKIQKLEDKIYALENTPILVDSLTPEIVQKVLSDQTADVSELVSAEYLFTNAAKFTDTSHIIGILDWMTEKSFIQQWDGTIKAGIDLTALSVNIEGQVITITMPNAKIISYEVDHDSVKVLDEKNNIFNPISIKDKNDFDSKTKDSMKARAIQNGLLVKAEENAQTILKGLLYASIPDIGHYEIQFVVGEPSAAE